MSARTLSIALALTTALGVVESAQAQSSPIGAVPAQRSSAITLRPGDILRIDVWPTDELSGEFTIGETGYVYLPLLEAVRAAGVALDDLRAELRRRYGEATRNPVVTITPMYRVSVTGAVQRPGIHLITPTNSLLDVIGLAGGFQGGADTENVRVVRESGVVEFNALRALETGQGMDAVMLRSGDHIVVPVRGAPLITWRGVFDAIRTVTTLILIWDRLN
jgi:polysaccharide export outer membrane protein